MVAVISGSGLGIFGSSVAALGGIGGSGQATAGRGNDRVYINTTTGNVVIQSQDERLTALGLDLNLVRTYNSQGMLDDDNGDNWRLGVHQRLYNLTRDVNTAGSTIVKVFGDGREVTYRYEQSRAAYVSSEGEGAHDTLTFSGGTWTWQEGSSHVAETYNSDGRMTHARDADGNVVTYSYEGSRLISILDASGQLTELQYLNNNLSAIRVTTGSGSQTLTRYEYDGSNRLTDVRVDLTPANSADAVSYSTHYTYDGASHRVATITQSDGSSVAFTYELIDGQYRVRTYTDGENRVTNFSYALPTTSGTGQTVTAGVNAALLSTTRNLSYGLNSTALTNIGGWGAAALLESGYDDAATPTLAFDAAGNGFALWSQGTDVMISRYIASTGTWEAPEILDERDDEVSAGALLAVDPQTGDAVVAWAQSDGTARSLHARRFSASSGTWGVSQLVETSSRAVNLSPEGGSISINGNQVAIAWLQNDGTTNSVYLSRLVNGAWSAPALVDTGALVASQPKVAIDAEGDVTVLWRQRPVSTDEFRINVRRWDASTQTFGSVSQLDGEGDRFPRIALDQQGNAFALWGMGANLRRYDAATGQWGAQIALHSNPSQARTSELAVDASGNALVAWMESDGTAMSMYARRYDAVTGTWGDAQLLESSPYPVSIDHVMTVSLRGGNGVVAWIQEGADGDTIVHAAKLRNGVWEAATQLEAREDAVDGVTSAIDAAGNATVLWIQADDFAPSVYISKHTPASYVVPSGATWQSIAHALYGIDSAAAGSAFQAALGSPSLTVGNALTDLPATLVVSTTVPGYYVVQSGDTWASITQAFYGSSEASAIEELQVALGQPSLAAGVELTMPTRLIYTSMQGVSSLYLQTEVTDALGSVSRYEHDAMGRLLAVTVAPNGIELRTEYEYDTAGNLTAIIEDPAGLNRITTMQYDANGNLLYRRDAHGKTLTRTYDAQDRLLTETVYEARDPDGAGSATASVPLTTHYTYDGEHHLRFVISPTGQVTEHRYNDEGERTATLTYTRALYTGTTFDTATLASWAAGAQNSAAVQRVDYEYDVRGNLETLTAYASADGAGTVTPSITRFVYDQRGQLLQTIDALGSANTPNAGNPNLSYATTYTYDGLGRVLTATQWISRDQATNAVTTAVTTYAYDDANRATAVTAANGLTTTTLHSRAGEVVSVIQGASGSLGTTTYAYDAAGNLRMETDPVGNRRFYLYDAAGRRVASVDGDGTLTELIYNSADQLIKTVTYAETVSAALLNQLANNDPAANLAALREAADGNPTQDVISRNVYDAAGQLIYTIDAAGAVTRLVYDGAGRLTDEIDYATLVSIPRAVDEVLEGTFTVITNEADRRSRTFYDADGKTIATLDAAGYLVQYIYDAAGRLVQQVAYDNQTAANLRAGGTLLALLGSIAGDPQNDQRSYFFYDEQGRRIGALDPEGYLTETTYDVAGNVVQALRYNRVLTYTAGTSTLATLKTAAQGATTRTVSYQYDGAGRVTQETNHEGTITRHRYDSVGNVISTTRAADTTEVRTTEARYDFLGRVVQELTAEGRALITTGMTQAQIDSIWSRYGVTYAYDLAGRRISATIRPNDTQTQTTLYFYDADNRLRFEVNALGERKEYRYNALNRLTDEIAYVNRISTNGLTGGQLTASLIGTLTASADGARDAHTAYQYTLTGRVFSERVARTTNNAEDRFTTYFYNAFGERVSSTQQIDATRTLLSQYTYDQRGLVTQTRSDVTGVNATQIQVYDAFGRLTHTTDARGNVWSTTYDRLGRVVASADPGSPAQQITYDSFSQVLTRTDALGNTTTYVHDAANRRVTITSPEGVVTTSVNNRHGETVTVTDGRGNVTTYGYDANGALKTVTTAAGTTTQNYDRAGQKIETIDANGISTLYTYDAAGRVLTRTVDPTGLNITTRTFYDGRGQAVWQQDANGIWTQMQYNRAGELVAIIVDPPEVPNGTSTQTGITLASNATGLNLRTDYTYDYRGKTLTVTEGVGSSQPRVTRYTYDDLGRRTEEAVDPSGFNYRTTFTYDANGNVVAKTDAVGAVTRYVYSARNELIYAVDGTGAVTKTDYDAEGRVIQTTAYANRISLTAPSALPTTIAVSDITARLTLNAAADQVTRTVYDRDGRVRYRIDAMNAVTQLTYDAAGNVVQTTRYATPISVSGTVNTTTIASAILTDAKDQTDRTVYDAANRAIFEFDAEGYVTQFVYDAAGHVTKQIQYANRLQGAFSTNVAPQIVGSAPGSGSYVITNAVSDRVTRTVYDAAGRVRFSVDGEGYVTELRYDAMGRQTRKIQYAAQYTVGDGVTVATLTAQVPGTPGANEAVEQRIYDAAGRMVRTIDAENNVTLHVYDAVGRETDTTVAYGTSDASTTHRVFNAAGYVLDEIKGYGTPEAATTRYIVDGVGNRTRILDPRGTELSETDTAWAQEIRTTRGYPAQAANLTAAQRGELRALFTTTQQFDANGNITLVMDPAGRTIVTEYDAFGNAVKITDQRGNSGYFYFDKNDRQVLHIDPEGYVTQTVYNTFGTVERVVHYANKVVGTVATNGAPAIITAVPNPVTGPYLLIDAARDQATVIEHDRRGLQTRITDAENNYESMGYDAFGNKTSYRDKLGSVYTYTHYRTGKVRTETSPEVTVTVVDATGFVSTTERALVKEFTYDARGNLRTIVEASGLPQQRITTISYDRLDREIRRDLPAITVFDGVGSDTVMPYTTTEYDRRGNVVRVRDAGGGFTYSYYDALDRKAAGVDATGTLSEYTYDVAGNLTRERTYTAQLTSVSTTKPTAVNNTDYRETSYVYDANNRQIASLTQSETYFDPRLLATLANGNSAVTNTGYVTGQIMNVSEYDATGNVVRTINGRGYATLYFYNKLGQQILSVDALGYVTSFEYDGNGNVTRESKYEQKLSNATIAALSPASNPQAIVTEVAGIGQDRVVEFVYDRLGRKTIERTLSVRYSTVSDGGVLDSYEQAIQSSFNYDAAGNLTRTIKADGSQTDYTYDELGRLIRQEDPTAAVYNGMSGATVLTTTTRARTEWEYDALGNRTRQTRVALTSADQNQVIRMRHDAQGNLITEWDGMSYRTDFDVDAAGRIRRQSKTAVEAVDTIGETPTSHTYRTYFTYDLLDRELSRRIIADEGTGAQVDGVETWTRYNAFGDISSRGVTINNVSKTQAEFRYDKLGHLLWTNADTGTPRAYVYDADGNAVIEVSQSSASDLHVVTSAAQVAGIAPNLVQYKFSVYDARNQITDVFQAPMDFAGLTGALTAQQTQELATSNSNTQGTMQPVGGSNPGASDTGPRSTRYVQGAWAGAWWASTPGNTSSTAILNPSAVSQSAHGQDPISLQPSDVTYQDSPTVTRRVQRTAYWDGEWVRETITTTIDTRVTSTGSQTTPQADAFDYQAGVARTNQQTTTTTTTTTTNRTVTTEVRAYRSTQVTSTTSYLLGGATTTNTQINYIAPQAFEATYMREYDQWEGQWLTSHYISVPAIAGYGNGPTTIVVRDPTHGGVVYAGDIYGAGQVFTGRYNGDPGSGRLQISKGGVTIFDGSVGTSTYYTSGAVSVTGADASVNSVGVWLGNGQSASMTRYENMPGGRQWIATGIGAANTNWQYNLYSDGGMGSLLGAVSGGSLSNPSSRSYYHYTRTDTEYFRQVVTDPDSNNYRQTDTGQVVQQSNYLRQLMYSIVSGTSLSNQIHRTNGYNAFGEVIRETDGRGNVTQYQYNELGQVIRKQDPTVALTGENGVRDTNFTPITQYYVDAVGQTIASTDANGFTTRQAIRNGRVVAQFNPDGNVERRYYDSFGNLAATTAPEINLTTRYEYDNNNRLIRTDFAGGNYDVYDYDALGNRIAHINGIGSRETYRYDAEGRITRYRSAEGRVTSYSYTYRDDIGDRGGYRKVTTDAMGNTQTDDVDMFGKIRSHIDLGGRIYTYNYNSAGWLLSQTSRATATSTTLLQNIEYIYYANGYVKEIKDWGINSTAQFQYDKDGNRTMESYSAQSLVPGAFMYGQTPYQLSFATYDALNRVVSIEEQGKYKIEYEYDKVGNRRRVRSEYHDLLRNDSLVQDFWYKYDSLNRFTTTMGQLVNGQIVRGTTGYDIGYNGANQRTSQLTTDSAGLTIKETYRYDDNGFLTTVRINPNAGNVAGDGVVRAERVNNAVGDKDFYYEYNSAGVRTSSHDYTYDRDHILTRDHDIDNNRGTNFILLADGRTDRSVSYNNADSNAATVTFQYTYENWDTYKQEKITVSGIANGVRGWRNGQTDFDYDVNGHLLKVFDHAENRTIWYANNHNGQTLKRLQWSGTNTGITPESIRQFYYLYGKPVGDQAMDGSKTPSRIDYAQELRGTELEGNGNKQYIESKRFESMPLQWQQWGLHYQQNGSAKQFQHQDIGQRVIPVTSADFDQNFQPINENYPPATAGTYVVVQGDTLRTIAAAVWGDSSLWYLIADANGFDGEEALVDDMRLTIPNVVANIHNNASTFRPVDPGIALGDTSPTLPDPPPPPQPKGKGCGVLGVVLVVIVAIVATVFTAGLLTGATAPGLTGIMSAGMGALGGGVSGITLAAGAVGAIASQGVAMALGMQEKFDWAGVATGAIGAAVGAGIGKLASNVSSLSWLNTTQGMTGFGAQAVRGAIGNAATQGISMAAGLQKQFSWSQVAASAAASGVNHSLGNWLDNKIPSSVGPLMRQFATGFGTSAASAAVHEAITGERANYGMIAAQSFGTSVGNSIVDAIVNSPSAAAQRIAGGIREELGDSLPQDKLAELDAFERSAVQRIREARHLEQTNGVAADELMGEILRDALQFYPPEEVAAARELYGPTKQPSANGDAVVTAPEEFGRALGLLDRPAIYAGRIQEKVQGQLQSWIDATPGAGLALNTVSWGMAIAGGPVRLVGGYLHGQAEEQATAALTRKFQAAQYGDQKAQQGGSGAMWIAGVALGTAAWMAKRALSRSEPRHHEFNNIDDFVRAANDPEPRAIYSINGISIHTDRLARPSLLEGEFKHNPIGRNDLLVQRSQGYKSDYDTDVGFHLWPDEAGAPTSLLTVVPGNGRRTGDGLPNLNNGAWGTFEKNLMKLAKEPGNTVRLRVRPVYNPGNDSVRPDKLIAQYELNGKWSSEYDFENKY